MLKKEQVADGMFQAATNPKSLPVQAHVGPQKFCGNCLNWRPRPSQQQFGECAISAGAGPAPIVTTDMQVCSVWRARPVRS